MGELFRDKYKNVINELRDLTKNEQRDKIIWWKGIDDNGDTLDAHYLGYDLSKNSKHKLYLNMLYMMVEATLTLQKREKIGRKDATLLSLIAVI